LFARRQIVLFISRHDLVHQTLQLGTVFQGTAANRSLDAADLFGNALAADGLGQGFIDRANLEVRLLQTRNKGLQRGIGF